MKKITRICPMCQKTYTDSPAMSMFVMGCEICPDCGITEQLAHMLYIMPNPEVMKRMIEYVEEKE